MICAAVVSGVDEFRRALRHRAPDAGVRLNLMLRMTAELTSASGLDVLILHQPSWDDIENVRSVTGTLPIVLVGAREIGPESVQDSAGWAVLSEDDPSAVLAAARAAAFGMAVILWMGAATAPLRR